MRRFALFILLAAGLACSIAAAQPRPDDAFSEPPGPPGLVPPPGPPELWDDKPTYEDSCRMMKERKMLEAVRITRMQEDLDLSEAQIAAFFPKLKQTDEKVRKIGHRRRELLRQLEKLLEARAKEADLTAKLDEIDKLEQERFQTMRAGRQELDALLNPEQRSRWRLFADRFDSEIRGMLRDIRERKHRRMK